MGIIISRNEGGQTKESHWYRYCKFVIVSHLCNEIKLPCHIIVIDLDCLPRGIPVLRYLVHNCKVREDSSTLGEGYMFIFKEGDL